MKSLMPGFSSSDLSLEPYNSNPDISDVISQVISRLLAWDYAANQYRSVICDPDGRLLVATSTSKTNLGQNSAATVTTSNTVILSENTSRRSFIIQNNGSYPIYLTWGSTCDTDTAFILAPSAIYSDDSYYGTISAKTLTGTCDVRLSEFS